MSEEKNPGYEIYITHEEVLDGVKIVTNNIYHLYDIDDVIRVFRMYEVPGDEINFGNIDEGLEELIRRELDKE